MAIYHLDHYFEIPKSIYDEVGYNSYYLVGVYVGTSFRIFSKCRDIDSAVRYRDDRLKMVGFTNQELVIVHVVVNLNIVSNVI